MDNVDILGRLTMTKLKAHRTAQGTVAWAGTITLDGKPFVRVSNEGRGGCNDYMPTKKTLSVRKMREQMATIEVAAGKAVGRSFEAFDSLTCCMENGMTARQAVTEWLKTG